MGINFHRFLNNCSTLTRTYTYFGQNCRDGHRVDHLCTLIIFDCKRHLTTGGGVQNLTPDVIVKCSYIYYLLIIYIYIYIYIYIFIYILRTEWGYDKILKTSFWAYSMCLLYIVHDFSYVWLPA